MERKNFLILNVVLVCCIAFLIIRDRLPSPFFELDISTKDEQSISVPAHLVHCQLSDNLHCEIPIGRQALVIEETGPLDCQARFGKQTPTCHWLQASALEYISIEELELTPVQVFVIKNSIKPFPTVRVFDNPGVNTPLLLSFLGFVSVLSGFNVGGSVFFYSQRFYPVQNYRSRTTAASIFARIAGFGVISFLMCGFILLLWIFGYVD